MHLLLFWCPDKWSSIVLISWSNLKVLGSHFFGGGKGVTIHIFSMSLLSPEKAFVIFHNSQFITFLHDLCSGTNYEMCWVCHVSCLFHFGGKYPLKHINNRELAKLPPNYVLTGWFVNLLLSVAQTVHSHTKATATTTLHLSHLYAGVRWRKERNRR